MNRGRDVVYLTRSECCLCCVFVKQDREDSVLTEEIAEDVNVFYRGLSEPDVNFSASQMAILFSYFKPVISVKNFQVKIQLTKTCTAKIVMIKDVRKKDVSNI